MSLSPSPLPFSKYHGTGNDFILVDDREGKHSLCRDQVVRLCHRQYGVGGDGVILLGSSTRGDYAMRIFNADGSEVEMCGNGLRCLVHFARALGDQRQVLHIETLGQTYQCMTDQEGILVHLGPPEEVAGEGEEWLVRVGVPHLVVFVEDLSRFDKEAKDRFAALQININYATPPVEGKCRVRTFERGVEKETFACGTGGAAVCVAAWHCFGCLGRVEVTFGSGEKVFYDVLTCGDALDGINMSGKVCHVYNGVVYL